MKRTITNCLLALPIILAASAGQAQEYPNRAIKMIQPASAGGFSDTLSRIIAKGMGERLGQPVIVENRPGAMNYLGAQMASRADPDGYTILYGPIDLTMMHALRKVAVDFLPSRDLTPIAMVASTPGVYVVNPTLPIYSLADLAAAAKAKDGKLTDAIPGFGGSLHLTSKRFELENNVAFSFIPYRGTTEAMLAIISGEVATGTFAIESGYANKERVRVLAQTGKTRHPLLPDVPTVAEAGMPNVGMIFWFGLFAPPNTPPAIIERLSKSLDETMKDPQIKESLTKIGAFGDYMPPAEFSKLVVSEEKEWGTLIPKMGIEPQ